MRWHPRCNPAGDMKTIDLAQLATVTGGVSKQPAKKLKVRKIGGVKLIGNESEQQMIWDAMPQ
jgi:hypothetical protein